MVRNIDTTLAGQFDQLPPHSLETERALLSSIMRMGEDKAAWAKVRALVGEDSFFSADHQIIFAAIDRILAAGNVADVTTVREALVGRKVLEECGGQVYLAEIWLSAPHSAHAVQYAQIIRERAMRRGLIGAANEALRRAYGPVDEDGGAERIAMDLAARAAKIATTGRPCDVYRLGDVAAEVFEAKAEGKVERIPTGLRDLDRLIGGLRIGGKTIIGAKPGMGKSLLLKQIGLNLARRGVRFGVVSIEEGRRKIAENALSNQSGVINNRISFGKLEDDDWRRFTQAVADLSQLPFFIVDSARRLSAIIAAIHTLHHDYGCQAIAVDHLHIVDGEGDQKNREREISSISAELKWVWKDLGVAGIEAAQLNRASGKDRPTLSSLRDSGSLEQDGDVVIMLHREDYYRVGDTPEDHVLELLVCKNKDGAPGTVPVHYDGARQSVTDRGDVFA